MREMTKTKESTVRTTEKEATEEMKATMETTKPKKTTVATGTLVTVETVSTIGAAQKRSEQYSENDNKIRPYHDSLRTIGRLRVRTGGGLLLWRLLSTISLQPCQ